MAKTIREFLEVQRKLDEKIYKDKNLGQVYSNIDVNTMTVTSAVTELCEFINEIEFFKVWKDNKRNDKDKQLEELADFMHFCLSIMNINGGKPKIGTTFETFFNLNSNNDANYLNEMFIGALSSLMSNNPYRALGYAFNIAKGIGITYQEIEDAYFKKHEKNYERLNNGY